MKTILLLAAAAGLGGLALCGPGDDVKPIPAYQPPAGAKLSGTLDSVGSDTMNNLMTLWAEAFKRHHADVKIQIEGKGSGSAPPALISGVAKLGPMSRLMKNDEIDKFEKQYGYKPTAIKTSLDALAVFVHKDNPIQSLSLEQVDAIFSSTRNRQHKEDVMTWGQLGLTGDWASKPISLFGRNSASGTYVFFKEHVLSKGDFKSSVKEQPGSSAVVQGVSEDRNAIGYSGIGYKTPNVRAVPLAAKEGGKAFEANLANVLDENYPLGRYLYIYVNRAPGKPLDPTVKEFLRFVLSQQGQEVVEKDGYLPLPADVVDAELKKLD